MNLSSLLVQRGVATIREVEEALARQVLYGGDFVTNLLEIARPDEAALLEVWSETLELPPGPAGELPVPSDELTARLGARVSVEYMYFPIEDLEDRLVVLVAEPVDIERARALATDLMLPIEFRATLPLRLKVALSRTFGIPLERRLERLLRRISRPAGTSIPVSLSAPPPSHAPIETQEPEFPQARTGFEGESHPSPSAIPTPRHPSFPADGSFDATAKLDRSLLAPPPDSALLATGEFVSQETTAPVHADAYPLSPEGDAAALGTAQGERISEGPTTARHGSMAPPEDAPSTDPTGGHWEPDSQRVTEVEPHEDPAEGIATSPEAHQKGDATVRLSPDTAAALGKFSKLEAGHDGREPTLASSGAVRPEPSRTSGLPDAVRTPRKRRGPFGLQELEGDLAEVDNRDAILDGFVSYCRQFFEYVALFVVHGDVAEGRDGFGRGASRERVIQFGFPLELPSILREARTLKRLVLQSLERDGVDAQLAQDLERAPGVSALAAPIAVRGRVVAILYADDDGIAIDEAHVHANVGLNQATALAGKAFEQILLRRKGAAHASSAAGEVPAPHAPVRFDPTPAPALLKRAQEEAQSESPPVNSGAPDGQPVHALSVESVEPGAAASKPSASRPNRLDPDFAIGASVMTKANDEGADQSSTGPARSVGANAPGTAEYNAPAKSEPQLLAEAPSLLTEGGAPRPWTPAVVRAPGSGRLPPLEETRSAPADDVWRPDAAAPAADDVWRPDGAPAAPVAPVDEDVWTPGAPSVAEVSHPSGPTALRLDEAPRVPQSTPSSPVLKPDLLAAAEQLASKVNVAVPASNPPMERHSGDFSASMTARKPPAPRQVAVEQPSIILEVEHAHADVVRAALDGSEDAMSEMFRLGPAVMPALFAEFPGKVREISIDSTLPRASDCGPVLKLIVKMRKASLRFVVDHADGKDPTRRFWATLLLAELPYIEALETIVARTMDESIRVRLAARTAARVLAETQPRATVDRLAKYATHPQTPVDERRWAIEALGEAGEPLAVPVLISTLDRQTEEICSASHASLVRLTLVDYHLDSRKWSSWWASNIGRHRVEWLIDALLHDDVALRERGARELVPFVRRAFSVGNDRAERERVHLELREWWTNEGRARFVREA